MSTHLKYKHNITSQQYYDKYLKKEGDGMWFYGSICNKTTSYNGMFKGYRQRCSVKCGPIKIINRNTKSSLEIVKDNNNHTCLICDRIIGMKGIHAHLKHAHSITVKDYYDKYLKKEGDGKCVMCDNPTALRRINRGYQAHCSKKCVYNNPRIE